MVYNWFETGLVPSIIAYSLSFIALLIGSLSDLKTREVPDWLNYGLVFSGVGLNLLFSIIYSEQSIAVSKIMFNKKMVELYTFSDQSYIISSIMGLVIFFGIAYIMFYAGQWGGGDSKMLIGLGAMIGIKISSISREFLPVFFINALFVGAVYGILWSIFLVFRNKQKFWKEFSRILSKKNFVESKKIILILLILMLLTSFLVKLYYVKILILSLAFLILTTFYLWIFVRAIEKSSMHKLVEPSKLTEGDWIVKDIIVNKEYIAGPRDLGVEKKQIKRLVELYKKGKINKVLIKEGIPFVPSFLIAFVVTFLFGNPLMWLI